MFWTLRFTLEEKIQKTPEHPERTRSMTTGGRYPPGGMRRMSRCVYDGDDAADFQPGLNLGPHAAHLDYDN